MTQQEEYLATSASPASTLMQVTLPGLTQYLDMSPDALVLVNQSGAIVLINKQVEEIFGYRRSELLGRPLEILLPQRFREAHLTHRQHYFTTPRTRPMGAGLHLFGRRQDETEFPVDISLKPLLLDDALHVLAAIRDVTEQRKAERERLQQLQQIRIQAELIDLAHDAIIVRDPISRVISWNRGAEELYGWPAQEALGRVTHTLLKTRFPLGRSALDTTLEQEGRWEGELTHTRRDDTEILVESRQVLIRDEAGQPLAILEMNRDITSRRRLEQAEQAVHTETVERLAFLQQVLDALPCSVYLVSGSDARLLLANRMAGHIWGAEWSVDQPMLEFLSSNGIEIFDAQGRPLPSSAFATLRAVQRGEAVHDHQETIRRRDGTSLPVLVNAVPLSSQRRVSGALSKNEQHPTARESIALVVHQDVAALKEAEYLKDEFVGLIAHELRTPLSVLAGNADTLLVQTARGHGPALAPWQEEVLQEIKQATARLVTLAEDLLDVTRLQAGRLILQCTPANLVPLIQHVATHMQRTTTHHRIEVSQTHSLLVADIDAKRIEQVMTNLLSNAIKYSPQGGSIAVTMWEETTSQTVSISVRDTGIGIPKRQHAQIFGRFMRADNAQAWGISGTGLGLYLCRELVERHGGHLWFESEEGQGSTFFITLPLIAAHREESSL